MLEKTWSCASEGPQPCGSCAGCRTRESAFERAVKPDPLKSDAPKPLRKN